ncbi:DUF975 family protein [Lacticaseibacillus hulanensis]|uniref:DUF975 family protein n=1 Tax=Lacticaseibacillus hulanensis TaxID=2493111 RepID=UPI000FD884F6|nr:DUF975 family protein [Lacticaseibacillus hulanensis]
MNNEDFYYMSRPELKAVAKDRLHKKGVWSKFALVSLIPFAVLAFIGFSTYLAPAAGIDFSSMDPTQLMDYYRSEVVDSSRQAVLTNLIEIFFVTGMSFSALDLVRNRDHKITLSSVAFRCFNSRYFWSVLGVDILVYVATSLGYALLIIPGILLSYGLSQAYFVLYDAREHGDKRDLFAVLAESYRMMRGHKFDFFVLELSFIGWLMLVLITAGLAYFWVGPYMTFTEAAFYEQVRVRYNRDQKLRGDDGAL